jgi:hypothetical protein
MNKGISTCTQYAYKDLCFIYFSGTAVDYGYCQTTVIDEQLLSGDIGLSHGGIELPLVTIVMFFKLTAGITFGVHLLILLPQ